MPKKEGHAYHKPKPRLAVYGGIAIGAARLGGDQARGVDVITGPRRMDNLKEVVNQIEQDPGQNVIDAGGPAAAGLLISLAADKLGANKVLAKMKAPFRI